MAIEIFRVDWTKTYPFGSAINDATAQESGVYAIYKQGGQMANLMYIGKSKEFSKRYGTHRNNATHFLSESEIKKCFVNFGIVSIFGKSRMTYDLKDEQLRDVESFLINTLQPSNNDPSTKKGYKGNLIVIVNTDAKSHRLDKVMSNSHELLNFFKEYI